MTSIYITSIIILLLIALVSYAFISQTLEKRRKHHQRLLMALKQRQRNFKFMLSGFPPGFLTQDLTILVYRALLDTCEQLSKLEPKDSGHREDIQLYGGQLEAIKNNTGAQRGRLESPTQTAEIRRQLQELYRFVTLQHERGHLTKVQAQSYSDQIKRLALQMSVDSYALQAKEAQSVGKPKLAIHYYTLARKLLVRENAGLAYQKQIAQISGVIAKLEQQAAALGPGADAEKAGAAPAAGDTPSKEWEEFGEEEDRWKKKQIYD